MFCACACAVVCGAVESEIPQAVATADETCEYKVNVRQEWTRNLLGDAYSRYVGWPTLTRLRSGELVVVFSGETVASGCDSFSCVLEKFQTALFLME